MFPRPQLKPLGLKGPAGHLLLPKGPFRKEKETVDAVLLEGLVAQPSCPCSFLARTQNWYMWSILSTDALGNETSKQCHTDWYSGLTSRVGLWLGGVAAGSIPRSAFVFCGGENVCVHSLCMGVSVCTALLTFTQLSSIIEGFKLCWRTGQRLTLNPSVFTYLLLNLAYHEKKKKKNDQPDQVWHLCTCTHTHTHTPTHTPVADLEI